MTATPDRCPKCESGDIHERPKLRDWTCFECGHSWDPAGSHMGPLDSVDLNRLPYPVAVTATRLARALNTSHYPLKTLFALRDCFEATIKFFGVILLSEYFESASRTARRNEVLLEYMIRPSLGIWVSHIAGDLSRWLIDVGGKSAPELAAIFVKRGSTDGSRPRPTSLLKQCEEFVTYRNSVLAHGATRPDSAYADDIEQWLPLLKDLLSCVAARSEWSLGLALSHDTFQTWMGLTQHEQPVENSFTSEQLGRFVLVKSDDLSTVPNTDEDNRNYSTVRVLYPFVCHLVDATQEGRFHFYDSLYRYKATRKEVSMLEYEHGTKTESSMPVPGLEAAFTKELLAEKFELYTTRMKVIDGRVSHFDELVREHRDIVGRNSVIQRARRFISENDRGTLIIEGEPGKGKTALLCHLFDKIFGDFTPKPVFFAYRHTAGLVDPDLCLRTLYLRLLEVNRVSADVRISEDVASDQLSARFGRLLSSVISPRVSPDQPQLIFIDALDEAETASDGRTAYERLPHNLPAGVFVIATTRHHHGRVALAGRSHQQWLDLDNPDLLQENLRDGLSYVQQELSDRDLPSDTLTELARVARGNFLVLKSICREVKTRLEPSEVTELLARLVTSAAEDQLSLIYEQFWQRTIQHLTPEDKNRLGAVACLLTVSRAALTGAMICRVLNISSTDGDFVLGKLSEFLAVIDHDEEGTRERYYRIYHESFADFLRLKLAADRDAMANRLADHCLRWEDLSHSDGYYYALRFAPYHLTSTRRWDDLEAILLAPGFLEAKVEADMVFGLASDLEDAVLSLPPERPRRRIVHLLWKAIRRDLHFIAEFPTSLFQCLWNTAWWYDCPAAALHYEPDDGPWNTDGPKISNLLEEWRRQKESVPGFVWLRALCPPEHHINTALVDSIRDPSLTALAYSPDGSRLAAARAEWSSTTFDGASNPRPATNVTLYESELHRELFGFPLQGELVTKLQFSPDGTRLASGSKDGFVSIIDVETGEVRHRLWHSMRVSSLSWCPLGRLIAVGTGDVEYWRYMGSENGEVRVWNATTGDKIQSLDVGLGPVGGACLLGENRLLSVDSKKGLILWEVQGGECIQEWTIPYIGGAVTFSPDGQRVCFAGVDRFDECKTKADADRVLERLGLWECDIRHGFRLCKFKPRNRTIVDWDYDQNMVSGGMYGSDGSVASVMYSPDGQCVASLSFYGIFLWDTRRHIEDSCLTNSHSDVAAFPGEIYFAPAGALVVSYGRNSNIEFWDVNAGGRSLQRKGPTGTTPNILHCSVASSDSRWIAFGADGVGVIHLWDCEAERFVHELHAHDHDGSIIALAFSSDSQILASGGESDEVILWNIRDGTQYASLNSTGFTNLLTFSADTRILACAGIAGRREQQAIIYDVERPRKLAEVTCDSKSLRSIALSSDSQFLAAASDDGQIFLWNWRQDNEMQHVLSIERTPLLMAFLGHDTRMAIAVSEPGKRRDYRVFIYNVETWTCIEQVSDLSRWEMLDALSDPNAIARDRNLSLRYCGWGTELVRREQTIAMCKASISLPEAATIRRTVAGRC